MYQLLPARAHWRAALVTPATLLLLLVVACTGDDPATPSPAVATLEATAPAGASTPRMTADPTPTTPSATPTEPAVTDLQPTATQAGTATPESVPAADPAAVVIELEPVADGFDAPLFVTHAGDGSGRVFVVEKGGTIRLLDGALFLDISDRVNASGSEQGLLGLAFHPNPETRYLYVNYTDANGDTVVSRFAFANDTANPDSEYVILTQEQPAGNHNGGMLAFGPDGYLYIGMGDGGGAYDRFGTAQDMTTLLGKMLRIDVDADEPYAIPPDNPFVDSQRPEIWAYGMRNPWRFAFDRATGDLFIADVGQATTEWVHFQPAESSGGENYAWPIYEGTVCHIEEQCDDPDLVLPISEYGREGGCAIIGGYVYRGERFPALQGLYLFSDLCSGLLWVTARDGDGDWQTEQVGQVAARVSSFGEDEAGELYLTDLSTGDVYRVTATTE